MTDKPKPRGLAAQTPERRKEIAAMGGRSIKSENRAFSRDPELAARAGRKGANVSNGGRGKKA